MSSPFQTSLARLRSSSAALSGRRRIAGFAVAVLGVLAVTLCLLPVRERIGVETVLLVFVLVSVAASAIGGILPAATAAVAGLFAANLVFTPPFGTLAVQQPGQLWNLVVFLAVAIAVGVIVEAGARNRSSAERARADAAVVSELGQREYGSYNLDRLLWDTLDGLGMDRAVLLAGHTQVLAAEGNEQVVSVSARIRAGEDLELVLYGPELFGADPQLLDALGAAAGRLWRSEQLALEASKAEELARIDQLRASLLAAVGHDLRTPLAAVKASVSTLRQDDVQLDPADTAELLEAIESNADRLGQLIADLLDMSRLQAGALSVHLAPVAVDEVLAAGLRRAQHHVRLALPHDLPLVQGDAGLLERVFENLIDNAQRHQPDTGRVLVTGRRQGTRVAVSVVDRGPGVPPERWDEIFQPFQHFGDHTTGGVGLGLAIARGFIEAQGGSITPSDTPGGGLTMTIDLPMAEPAPHGLSAGPASGTKR